MDIDYLIHAVKVKGKTLHALVVTDEKDMDKCRKALQILCPQAKEIKITTRISKKE